VVTYLLFVDSVTATRTTKKEKPTEATVINKVDGLRNRSKKSAIEAAIELRAKRDISLVSIRFSFC